MFRNKTTITRPDRDRLVRVTQAKTTLLRWGLFVDELLREIKRARVISPARVPADVVTMHSTVRIRDAKRTTAEVFTLVYPEEAAPRFGKLSVLTPIGTALLGARVGDIVRVATGDGLRRIAVEGILYQPEAASETEAQGETGPLAPDEALGPRAVQLARTRRALGRARRGELVLVYVMASLVLLTMLPVVIAAAAAIAAVMLWRHVSARWRQRRPRAAVRASAVQVSSSPVRSVPRRRARGGRARFVSCRRGKRRGWDMPLRAR